MHPSWRVMESSSVKKQSTETRKHYTVDYGGGGGGGGGEAAWGFFHLRSVGKDKIYGVSATCKGGRDDIQAQFLRQQRITRCVLFLFLTCCCSSSCLLICLHGLCCEEEQIKPSHTCSWRRPTFKKFILCNLMIRLFTNILKFLWRILDLANTHTQE